MRNLQIFQLAQDQLQLRDLFLVGLAHHHGGIHEGQHGAHVVDELDRPRTIDEGVAVPHERGGRHRQLDAHLYGAIRGWHPDRGAPRPCQAPNRAGARQDRLGSVVLPLWNRPNSAIPWTRSRVSFCTMIAPPARAPY